MSRVARLALVAVAGAVVVFGAGCSEYSGTQKPGPADGASLDFTSKATVTIDDNGISPADLRLTDGDAVTVVNHGTGDHGLTSDTIETGTLQPGDSTVVFLTVAGKIDAYDRTASNHRIEIDVSPQSS
jgi:plastocyanin